MRSLLRPSFLRAREGTVAIEFAFIAPILITLFVGTMALCNALICRAKVTSVAASAADLVAQDSTISTSQLNDVFSAVNALVYPYPSAGSRIIITSIKEDPVHAGQYVVDWSVAQNTTAHSQGAVITVPTGLVTHGASVILAEISYTYTPPSTEFINAGYTMTDSFYARPRRSGFVTKT